MCTIDIAGSVRGPLQSDCDGCWGVQRWGSLAGPGPEQPGLCVAWAGEPSAACLLRLVHVWQSYSMPQHHRLVLLCTSCCLNACRQLHALLCLGQTMLQCCSQASMHRNLACRHAASAVSEAPVLRPLTPLGDFISQVSYQTLQRVNTGAAWVA